MQYLYLHAYAFLLGLGLEEQEEAPPLWHCLSRWHMRRCEPQPAQRHLFNPDKPHEDTKGCHVGEVDGNIVEPGTWLVQVQEWVDRPALDR